jgi:hypothetical protein
MRKPLSGVPGLFSNTALLIVIFLCLCLFSARLNAEEYEATAMPWSGYWWPVTKGGLSTGLDYRGHPAPLEKYELLTLGNYPDDLVSWYEDRYYDPDAPSWYGLCAYWAQASCYEHMEILPSSEDNIVFRVGDKKGLLTLAHDDDEIVEDETPEGLDPDEFHYWLLSYIMDRQEAFVEDKDPGEEVWSYPIYRYEMEITADGNSESVEVVVYYANDFVSPDYMGTEVKSSTYTYDLFLDGAGNITGGEWTEDSINDHPGRLTYPLEAGTNSPYLDYDEVVRLAESRDDFLEADGETVTIAPGTYHLILLDEDVYRVGCSAGDTLSVYVEKQDGSQEDMTVIVTDNGGSQAANTTVGDDEPLNLVTTAGNPPYTIRLSQIDYTDPNIYTLTVDMVKAYNQKVPYIHKQGMWSGFSLTNPNTIAATGVTLTSYTEEGQPLETLLGPMEIAAGKKTVFFFDDLPWRRHELSDTDIIALMSDIPVNMLNLFGNDGDSLACVVQGEARGFHLIIPDTVAPMTPGKSMFGGIANESFQETTISMRLYYKDGSLQQEIPEVIGPRATFSIQPGFDPFYSMPDDGWIEVIGTQGQDLYGYQYTDTSGVTESLFGLDVGSSQKIVPHVTKPDYWITTVTLINPNDLESRVNLHLSLAGDDRIDDMDLALAPNEKMSLELQDQFGKYEGDPAYHSILEIQGEYPVAGYYTYSSPSEEASYPLIDQGDFKRELVLPHNPSDTSYWWTGVGICNPSSYALTVSIEPYDSNGNLMESDMAWMSLDAGAYEVFTMWALFGEIAPEISFVRFRVEDEQGSIAGFYLYGNTSNEMLGGANM